MENQPTEVFITHLPGSSLTLNNKRWKESVQLRNPVEVVDRIGAVGETNDHVLTGL